MTEMERQDVYVTLLLTDSYLPGALVLAHSLRDAGTSKKLAVLVTIDGVSDESITELDRLYDYILPVERLVNESPANLHLMGRLDLHAAFTKIALWRQEQFRRIVYVDADVVALRAPDELFDLPHPFSAAPDIGWPDLFNSGVMVLTPNMGDYYALLAMAQRGISFDGADQGLLNMYFKDSHHRLSFTYNVTPSSHYQYLPAFRHFQSAISMVHFIGSEKPWTQGREAREGGGPYDELVGRWWAVYDRHYRNLTASQSSDVVPWSAQKHVKGEYHPHAPSSSSFDGHHTPDPRQSNPAVVVSAPEGESQGRTQPHFFKARSEERLVEYHEPTQENSGSVNRSPSHQTAYTPWDASRRPPPIGSKPEASNLPDLVYTMSTDPEPFKAPEKYPDPPKSVHYEIPKPPTHQKSSPIFPWETRSPKATRVFPEDCVEDTKRRSGSANQETGASSRATPPATSVEQSDPWMSYSRKNAWDDIPGIANYIARLERHLKGGVRNSAQPVSTPQASRRPSLILTDFPTELERPSLPVTPAPIHRPTFWGGERDAAGELPAAAGVPNQADWDPAAQLEVLAQRKAQVINLKLGKPGSARGIPNRPLPYGSEGVVIPTPSAGSTSE